MDTILIETELHKLHLLESKLSQRFIKRKDRKLEPIRNRIKSGFASAFQREKYAVLNRFDGLKYQLKTKMTESTATALSFNIKMVERKLILTEVSQMIDDLGSGINLTLYERILQEAYPEIFKIANAEAELQISTTVGWNVRHRLAEQFIRERSQEYIAKYLPSVKQTTLDRIQTQLLQGIKGGESIDEIKNRLVKVYDGFSESRAETWARDQTNRAYCQGSLEAYKGMGVQQKFWISSGSPYAIADVCGENAALGSIGIGEFFSDIEGNEIDGPTAHPNCECSIGFDVSDDWIPNEAD